MMNSYCVSCPALGQVQELQQKLLLKQESVVKAMDVDFYKNQEGYQVMIDNYLIDVIRPQLTPTAWKVICFLIRHTKANHNDAIQRRFTYAEILEGTGIKSRSSLWEALSELEEGLTATENRPSKQGWQLIDHITDNYAGNMYGLNLEREVSGQPLLFYPQRGGFTQMHHVLFDMLMPLMTAQQWSMFWFIWRRTIGWGKQADHIAMAYFRGHSGINTPGVIRRVLGELENFGLIMKQTALKKKAGLLYFLNKDLFFDVESRAMYTQVARYVYPSRAPNQPESRAKSTRVARYHDTQNHDLNPYENNEKNIESNPSMEPIADYKKQLNTDNVMEGKGDPIRKKPSAETPSMDKPIAGRLCEIELLPHETLWLKKLQELGIESEKMLSQAMENLRQGLITEAHIENVRKHQEAYPGKHKIGLYAKYLAMSRDEHGQLIVKHLIWPRQEQNLKKQSLYEEQQQYQKTAPPPQKPIKREPPPSKTTWGQRDTWGDTLKLCQEQVSRDTFDSTLKGSELVGVEDNVYIVKATSAIASDWLNDRAIGMVERNLRLVSCDKSLTVRFT